MKKYDSLQALFDDGIIQHSDMLAFWGKRGFGKSSLMNALAVWFMQPRNARQDLKLSRQLCDEINLAGFNLIPPPNHLVFTNTFGQSVGPGLKRTRAYEFNDVEFGLPNDKHPTAILCPCGKYLFDENQDLFDSHLGHLASFVSKSMELSRHIELFIMFALQRTMRLPQDIRDLTTFFECIRKENFKNKYGRLIRTEWTVNIIYDNRKLEPYLDSDNPKYIDKTIKIIFHGNIYKCYNSRYFLPMFYAKGENSKLIETTLRLKECKDVEFSKAGFKEFFQRHKIDVPDTYRGKKQTKRKESSNGD